MDSNLIKAGWIFVSSMILAVFFTPVSIWIAVKTKITDYPGKTSHTIHKKEVPRAGGIALIFSLAIAGIVHRFTSLPQISVIFLSALVIFIFGIWDDRFGMTAPKKLFGQVLAVTVLVLNGVRVQFFENPQFFISLNPVLAFWIDVVITYFWIIAITNAFNLIDSMDGLALGLAEIAMAFFLISAISSNQSTMVYLSTALLGICLGIFFFNRSPAKTFLGDSGAQTLGFILSALAIIYHPKAISQSSSWFIPIMVFGVPIFDTTLVSVSRTLKGIPIYKANLDHTYHRLVNMGWKQTQAVTLMHFSAICCGIMALICVNLTPLIANIFFALWIIFFLGLLIFFEKTKIFFD